MVRQTFPLGNRPLEIDDLSQALAISLRSVITALVVRCSLSLVGSLGQLALFSSVESLGGGMIPVPPHQLFVLQHLFMPLPIWSGTCLAISTFTTDKTDLVGSIHRGNCKRQPEFVNYS